MFTPVSLLDHRLSTLIVRTFVNLFNISFEFRHSSRWGYIIKARINFTEPNVDLGLFMSHNDSGKEACTGVSCKVVLSTSRVYIIFAY